jgi:pectate lyase
LVTKMKKIRAVLGLSLLALVVACSSTSEDSPIGAAGSGSATAGSSNAQAGNGVTVAGSGPGAIAGAGSSGGIPGAAGAAGGASTGGVASAGGGGLSGGGISSGGVGGGGSSAGPGTAGTAPIVPYVPAWACLDPTWPTPTGSAVSLSSTKNVPANAPYDGKLALHNGSGSGDFVKDCSAQGTGSQGTTKALFELEDGATIQNVIVGNHGADGIHCKGTCTIKNVWFQNVCDDMVTAASGSSGTVTIDGGGARNAHDKLFQDNSHGKFIVQNFYGEKLGKMYRACGEGGACDSTKGNLTMTNVTAVGVDQVVGLTKGRDKATLSKICLFQAPTVCQMYDSSDNKLQDGPDGTTCIYKWTDTQVMVSKVNAVFATASACPNTLTSGSASNPATACIADLSQCIKSCLPGDNGLKVCDCTGTGSTYKCHTCALPAQDPAKSALSPAAASVAPACSGVTEKKACSKEWEVCKDGTQVCACVFKPGYLQTANTIWDCANPWW